MQACLRAVSLIFSEDENFNARLNNKFNFFVFLTNGCKQIVSLQNFVLKSSVLMLTVISLMDIVKEISRKLKLFVVGKS